MFTPGLKSHLETMIEWIKTDRAKAVEIYGQEMVEKAEGLNALASERVLGHYTGLIDLTESIPSGGNVVRFRSPLAAAIVGG